LGLSKKEKEKFYSQYRSFLLDGIAPFWLERIIDREHGGVLTCMSDSGKPESGDKFMWSQCRSVWTFSALYNRIDARPEFLDVAKNTVRFILAHGRDDKGRWVYHTTREGRVLEGAVSIYSDCFAVYGLSEYYRATRDEQALAVARETFEQIVRRIEAPDFNDTMPYPMPPGWRNHAVPMMMTEVTHELAQTIGDSKLEDLAAQYANRIMTHFVKPYRKVLLEYLTHDYQELPSPAGTFVMPGHAIESMWFVLHVARLRHDQDLIQRACEVMRWHLEYGWDEEYGGLINSRDTKGGETFLPHSEKKMWWPHAEALYATLLGYELTGHAWCLEWYKKIADWSWAHFPMPDCGEWYQRLTREGKPTEQVVTFPVKDPFHLPRAIILILQLMGEKR
jgi:N-acylglucosamine 2-epimerase